jgi:molybdopterin-containing oxidoreductase family iron-sulfur binding subunit
MSRDGLKKLSDAQNFYDVLLQQMDNSLKEVAYIDICRNLADKIFASPVSKDSSIIASNSDDFFKGILARGGWWNVNKKSATRKNAKIRVINAVSNVAKPSEDFHLIPFKSHVFGDGNALSTPWAQASPDPITSITWDSWVEINTKTAERLKIKQGDIIKVSSKHGQIELPAYLHPGVPFESVGIPIGQGKNFSGRYSENRGANVVDIIGKSSLNENDDIPWCATSVKLQKTGRKKKVSKFEGSVPAIAAEPGVPIMTLGSEESAEEGYHRYHKEHLEHTFGDNFKNDKKEEK